MTDIKNNRKLIRITTIPLSLEKLLGGQLEYMSQYFEVTAISSEENRLKRYAKEEGVNWFFVLMTRKITPLQDIISVFKLYKFLKRTKPEIVHTHTPKAGIVGMMAGYFAKVPIRLHTVAGLPLLEAKGLKRFVLNQVEKWTYKFATVVYPNSTGLLTIITKEKFAQAKKLKILGQGSSNGIDTSFFSTEYYSEEEKRAKRDALKIPQNSFVFVFVGRLVKDKGINELVKAFVSLQNEYTDCSLLLVGPFEDDLDPVSEEAKLQINTHEKIVTTGFQNDVRIFYAISDTLVFPSYREGFPNVVLQAGAMSLPSIVTDINGCNEIITDGKNGLICNVKDATDLEKAMEKLLTDTQLRNKLKSVARNTIVSKYEREAFWKILKSEYDTLLSNL